MERIKELRNVGLAVLMAGLILIGLACTPGDSPVVIVPDPGPDPDTTPPAAVGNFTATPGSQTGEVQLSWVAPGDDGMDGTADAYVLKFSFSPIDENNFDAANDYSQSWTPAPSGNVEIHTLTGLIPATTYYFGVKALDEESNLSPLATASCQSPDFRDFASPAPITDLAASTGTNPGEIDIAWTATGDDGSTGTATTYVVKTSTSPITSANFDSATTYNQSWTPAAAGNAEARTLSGLAPGTIHYVAMKAIDEASNVSTISNVASATSGLPLGDVTPPATVTDLGVQAASAPGIFLLNWTAVGDDGTQGNATTYELRYATAPVTSGSWGSATVIAQSWTPRSPGTREIQQVTGLPGGTVLYFGLVVKDEVPNVSGVSNSPSATGSSPAPAWNKVYPVPVGNENLRGVWAATASDVFAVGDNGYILYYNGSVWIEMPSPTTQNLNDVWGTAVTDVWAVGAAGTILHFNGNAWSSVTNVTSVVLNGVHGSSASDVFVVGAFGNIFHYDGNAWSVMTSGVTYPLSGVYAAASNDVYAVG
ncbi:MAG: fibronectin type III domain-containing protein, partial [Planctomycetota bacterium]